MANRFRFAEWGLMPAAGNVKRDVENAMRVEPQAAA